MGGFANIPEKIGKEKTIWFNCRQEPVAYVNGISVTPRSKKNPHVNIESVDCLEDKLISTIEGKKAEGKVKLTKDKAEADNPMDREEEDEDHPAAELKGFTKMLTGMAEGAIPGMQVLRVPLVEEKALPESALDVIVNKMVETGIGSPEWAENIIKKSFEELAQSEDLKDSYLMGEFDVIKELLEKLPAAKEGKILADKMIDNCGTPPEGTGIQNLRKCIIRTKYKYDAATEDRQIVWKKMIINFIERYFYLICFATYAKEQGPTMFPKSFVAWMDEHKDLR